MSDVELAERVANILLPPSHWGAGTRVRFIDGYGWIAGPSLRLLRRGVHVVRHKDGTVRLIPFERLALEP